MTAGFRISPRRRRGTVLGLKLAVLTAAGLWMADASEQPPPPPPVAESACRGCADEQRAMAKWNAARTSERWRCRRPGDDWASVEACLVEASKPIPWSWNLR